MKKITMLFAALLACVGVMKAQTVMGLTELPTTAVDLSTTDLTTGYYLIKQTNTAKTTGFLKAASEAVDVSVAPNGTPTAGADTEAAYIWYVEVAEDGKFSVSTANKVAGWQAPTQKGKKLVAYDSKATTLELEKDFASLNGTTQTLVKAYWSDQSCYSYVHDSGNVLGSWNDQNTASLYYIEFYAVPAEDLIVYDPVGVAKAELSSYIAEVSAGLGSKIALQTSDANAAGYLSSGGSADGNVEGNMIDGKNDTFYGSPWGGSIAGVDYQYWQVDLGDEGVSMKEFVFSYVTRANGDDTPYSIVVKGSNDGSSFENLATISEGLPQSGNASYTSSTVSNPSSYRYLRFDVTDARKGNGANPGHAAGGHTTQRTFALAEFELINKDEASWSEHEKAIKTAIDAAQEVLDNDDATVEAVAEALHNVKVAEVVKPVYPFTVTTDDESPVLYAIKSGRGDAYWYTYDATDGKIALSQYTGAQEQQWFFKEVLTEDYQYAVQLYPYADATKAMSYENTNNAAAKIVAQVPGTEGWTNLWVSVSTDGAAPYGLQTYDKKNYLSNNGGTTNKMGMWNAAPASDSGTAMYFSTPAEVLQALIDAAESMYAGEGLVGGGTVESISALKEAVATAQANMGNNIYSTEALQAAIDGIETIQPEEGKYYTIVSATEDARNGQMMYVNHSGNMHFCLEYNDSTLFQFVSAGEGKFYLYNAVGKSYLSTAKGHGDGQEESKAATTEEAKAVTISNLYKANVVKIVPEGGAMMHAQSSGASIVGWNAAENVEVSASAWTIVEVDIAELTQIKVTAENGETWADLTEVNATLQLTAAVTPNVGTDYTITWSSDAEELISISETGLVTLLDYCPTYRLVTITATMDNGKKATFDLNVMTEAAPGAVTEIVLVGPASGELIGPKGTTCQIEAMVFPETAADKTLTWTYSCSWCECISVDQNGLVTIISDNTEDGGMVTITATASNGVSATCYLAVTIEKGNIDTAIESVEAESETVIYDLLGRRVEKMEKGGIYIVNGKKVIK